MIYASFARRFLFNQSETVLVFVRLYSAHACNFKQTDMEMDLDTCMQMYSFTNNQIIREFTLYSKSN